MIATALIAVLALSVGAFAYPVVVGTHPLSTAHAATPATVTHPKTGEDNSTANQTNENETADNETGDNETAPVPPAPEANETENETDMSNVSVEHNVTVTTVDNTTYVNGTIMVLQGNTTLVDLTFQIVAPDNGTANVTLNETTTVGSTVVTVHGFAVYSTEDHTVDVFGVAMGTSNGTVQWQRMFAFEAPSSCSGWS